MKAGPEPARSNFNRHFRTPFLIMLSNLISTPLKLIKFRRHSLRHWAVAVVAGSLLLPAYAEEEPTGFEQRQAILATFNEKGDASAADLAEAMENDHPMVRRTAAHLLVRLHDAGREYYDLGMANDDFQVRRIFIDALVRRGELDGYLRHLLTDPHPAIRREFYLVVLPEHFVTDDEPSDVLSETMTQVYSEADAGIRLDIIRALAELSPTPAATRLLNKATRDEEEEVSEIAVRAVVTPKLDQLEAMISDRDNKDALEVFGDYDFTEWPDDLAFDGFRRRATLFTRLDKHEEALRDLERALEYQKDRGVLVSLAALQQQQLEDSDAALETYARVKSDDATGVGRHVVIARIAGASILRERGDHEEALEFLGGREYLAEVRESVREGDWTGTWPIQLLTAYGDTLAALGETETALECYQQALATDGINTRQETDLEERIAALGNGDE